MDSKPYLAAAVQLQSGPDVEKNLDAAERWIRVAAGRGAELIALPELFTCLGPFETIAATAQPIPGPISRRMGELARELGVVLLAGSLAEWPSGGAPGGDDAGAGATSTAETSRSRFFNCSLLFDRQGRELARYRKSHLFDIDLPGQVSVRESDHMLPGQESVAATCDLGCLGLAICYDLRFPEHFRRLIDAGAEVLLLPSAFTLPTGRDHWMVLLQARAIENQAYVIAPNQFGRHSEQLTSYGRSSIIDPWGTVLATAPDGEGLALAEIDPGRVQQVRQRLPALRHRRWK